MTIKTTEFVDWLRSELELRGWSYQDLADRAGFTKSAVSIVLSQRQNPGLEFCKGVARAFNTRPEIILQKAGLISPAPDRSDPTMQELIYLFDQLPDREQKRVLQLLRAWTAPDDVA